MKTLDALGDSHRTEIIETTKVEVFEHLKENLRPEFLNRIDEQIMFLPLSREEIKSILKLLLKKVDKMLAKQGMIIKLSENALNFLAGLGYDPQFGARPMKRVLQKEVVNELSKHVLSGEFVLGDTIYIDANKKGLIFSRDPFDGAVNIPEAEEDETEAEEAPTGRKRSRRSRGKSNGEDKAVQDRLKQIENLKKATKDVEDSIKDMKKKEDKSEDTEEDKS